MTDLNQMAKMMETDPAKAMEQAGGAYKDMVTEHADVDSKLATMNMPKAPDPSPFSMGPLTTGQR